MVISFGTVDELVELVLLRRKSSSLVAASSSLVFAVSGTLSRVEPQWEVTSHVAHRILRSGDLSKDVFCVLIVYSCRSVGVCREVFRVRVRLYVCEQILQQYFQFERVKKRKKS